MPPGTLRSLRSTSGTAPGAIRTGRPTLHGRQPMPFTLQLGVTNSRMLRWAADAYDRAARAPFGRIRPRTSGGDRLGLGMPDDSHGQ